MKNNRPVKIVILIILALSPALFPFGGRVDYNFALLPSFIDKGDETFVPWVLCQHIFGTGSVVFTIAVSVLYYFVLFWAGCKADTDEKKAQGKLDGNI